MNIKLTLLLVLVFGLYSCSNTLKVYSTHEKDVDFKSYKTFDFYDIKEEHLSLKEVNRRRLAMAIELELGYKGYKRHNENPDLLVNLYSLMNRTVNTAEKTSSVGYYGAATPYGAGIGVSVSPQGKYSEYYAQGTVTIDLVDRVENRLILEGVAKIDAGSSDDANRIINYTVKKVFADIPDAVKRRQ